VLCYIVLCWRVSAEYQRRSEELRARLRALAKDHAQAILHIAEALDPGAPPRSRLPTKQKLHSTIVKVCLLALTRYLIAYGKCRVPLEDGARWKIVLNPPRRPARRAEYIPRGCHF